MTEFKEVCQEFLQTSTYLAEKKKEVKKIQEIKKALEDQILEFMEKSNIKALEIGEEKIIRQVQTSYNSINRDVLLEAISGFLGDAGRAQTLTDQVLESRIPTTKSRIKISRAKSPPT